MGHEKKGRFHNATIDGWAGCPKTFVFVDKRTGTRRFEVKADKNGRLPMEEAVNLLAIHCVARHQAPADFGVMVSAGRELFEGIAARTTKLIQTCVGPKTAGFPLSRRQREVLTSIAQNLSNKEIAAKLNISVRTIKFHVSMLLEKFDVRGRVDLMLESAAFLPVDSVHKRVSKMEPMAVSKFRAIPLLPGPTSKLLLAAPVHRGEERTSTIGVGKRPPRRTSGPSSSMVSPRAAS
jgi:DNA-binding CsgD family transcriptional regulator